MRLKPSRAMFVLVNAIYTVSLLSRVVFKIFNIWTFAQDAPSQNQTGRRRHRDASVRDLKFVNELQTHSCTPARTHSRADKWVK